MSKFINWPQKTGLMLSKSSSNKKGCLACQWLGNVDMHMYAKFDQNIWASVWDFQQCGILTCVDSDRPGQPPFKLRNSKWCSVSSLTIIEYSSDKQRLWSDCAYAQADLRLCGSHIPHCWKSHALAQLSCGSRVMSIFTNWPRTDGRAHIVIIVQTQGSCNNAICAHTL